MVRFAHAARTVAWVALCLATPHLVEAADQTSGASGRRSPPASAVSGVDPSVIRAYLAERERLSLGLAKANEKKAALASALEAETTAEKAAAEKEERELKAAAEQEANEKKAARLADYKECTTRQTQCLSACDRADMGRSLGTLVGALAARGTSQTSSSLAMLDSMSTTKSCKEACEATSCTAP